MMTAKEYLNQIQILDNALKHKVSDLESLQEAATAIGSFDYSQDRVQTSPSGEAPYAKTIEKAAELDQEIGRLIDCRNQIISQIYGLTDQRYVAILVMRYIDYDAYDDFYDIAEALGYSYEHTVRLHGEALELFESCYKMSYQVMLEC